MSWTTTYKNKGCINCLEYLSRHGLDARVLQEYKQCGLLYYSKRYNELSADIDRFVDFDGVDRDLIRKIDDIETELDISIYHIIWNPDNTLILMFLDPELDIDYQLRNFKCGECTAIQYNIKEDFWIYTELHFEVRLGAVVDTEFDYNQNM